MTKVKHLVRKTSVPLYPCVLYLVVDEDWPRVRQSMSDKLGKYDFVELAEPEAMHSWKGGYFALFFYPDADWTIIAHEIFHATMRIMWFIGCEHDGDKSEEAYAMLNGWITEWVCKRWGKK